MTKTEKAIAWLKDKGDNVEQACAGEVCALIPEYAVLWARFIGNTGPAERYPLEGLDKLSAKARAKIEKSYDGFCAAHYTLFNHVHSCQRKIQKAEHEELQPRTGLTHFAFMEAMEEFYFHFGIIVTQWERLWACMLALNPNHKYLRAKIRQLFTRLFGAESPQAKVYQQVLKTIVGAVRNTVEHYPRTVIFFDPNLKKLFVLWPRIKAETWQQTRNRPGTDFIPAVETMRRDLDDVVTLIRATHPKLIELLEAYLKKRGLRALAEDAFEAGDDYPVHGLPSCSANISSSQSSTNARPLNTGSAVYPPRQS